MSTLPLLKKLDELNLWEREFSLLRNEFLLKKGNTNDAVYLVVNGSIKILIIDNDEEQIIRFGYRNSIIAALDTFISGKTSQFYIQAIKKTTLKVVSKETFMQLV